MATSLKILVANTQFSVMLETSWSQCQTLLLTLRWMYLHALLNASTTCISPGTTIS